MRDSAHRAVAIVGVGAVLPDAPDARAFWQNIREGRYSISDVSVDRWNPDVYYDPDPKASDRTYSKIGGWVRQWEWDPLKWRLPIPPRVGDAMDLTQKWAVIAAREALSDYGHPSRPLDQERTAVILGNAMGGDGHLYSSARILFQEYEADLAGVPEFAALPADLRRTIRARFGERVRGQRPEITEDTMPGELSNIVAGRIASIYDFKGPNFVTDAACASAMAAISAAMDGLVEGNFDAVLTGGIDANMSPATFVKFCKIGALSATGTRPYAEGADGFVMGEGAAVFVMKRLRDAERDGDTIYAVVRGVGGSSDGKGKGITAPNPAGQRICVRRAWESAGVVPTDGDLIEGHGTSTRVGDVVEVESLIAAFQEYGLPKGSLALGSVKSNIGHLKGAAGAAGILKAMFALHEKTLPPSLNFHTPNPGIDFEGSPLRVNTSLRAWEKKGTEVRRAGVSAFGFGGTNFHTVLEEYIPGRIRVDARRSVSVPAMPGPNLPPKAPSRGALVIGGASEAEIISRLRPLVAEAEAGRAPAPVVPAESDLRGSTRLAIDYGSAAELADKGAKALKAFEENQPGRWKALRAKGIFLGKGPAPKVAFLFSGQGSQYVNMLRTLRDGEPVVAETYATADRVMEPLLGRPLSACVFLDTDDEKAVADAEVGLKQTAITQPAVLTAETALCRLLGAYGVVPDMVMGHSLGEYGALVAAGALSFEEALRAVSARGTEMTRCAVDDNGMMAAVFGPVPEIEKALAPVDGYVVVANINSTKEAVIGGGTAAVEKAMEALREAGYVARPIQVSHAFHTQIVAPASASLARLLEKMDVHPPELRVISNVTGEFYPMGPGALPAMIDLLGRQVSSPVQFVKGLRTLYDAGARVFVEVGPKRILYGFVDDVLGEREGVWSLFTNHPRIGDVESFNLALCGLYASGVGVGLMDIQPGVEARTVSTTAAATAAVPVPASARSAASPAPPIPAAATSDRYAQLGRLFVEFLDRSYQVYSGEGPVRGNVEVVVSGAALGLPGVDRVFDDSNVERILRGDQFLSAIPLPLRRAMLEKNVTRLVKSETGEGRFETIESMDDGIKLAARAREYDLVRDFGFPEDRMAALDHVTKLAIGAGIDALRDAGIPLVLRYKTTTKGTQLPDRFMLPVEMRDDTGVIFGSAFPGYDAFAEILSDFYRDRNRREKIEELSAIRARTQRSDGSGSLAAELDRRIRELQAEVDRDPYRFDRRFLFRVLSMGHSQFAEYIGARGPNTAINAACATGTQAASIASDWIQTGRCRRVIVITADDVTSEHLMEWHGAGFLASGAAATDEIVEEAALPFDRRRHGLLIGMGAAAMVFERADAARERGVRPICEVLGAVTANSAFHGTRLDVGHICQVMESLVSQAEAHWGIRRSEIAPETVFVSHETYTPARGGSASAEVFALRHVFGEFADRIVIANTKGATGHPMAVGIEDVVAVKILETGVVPPVPNFKEVDPELGVLTLSKGGAYPVRYALRLGAGFGSQISMTLTRWAPSPDGRRPLPGSLGFAGRIADPECFRSWLARATGQAAPELEVVQRTLRVKDRGAAARLQPASTPLPVPAKRATDPALPRPTVPEPAAPAKGGAVPSTLAIDPVQEMVLRIIAEKTGYPPDMLQMDLDLEADLGIDTVKQAEMFAAIRAAWDIPRDDNLKLRDFPTLAHTVQFVYERRPDLRKPAAPGPPPSPPAKPAVAPRAAVETSDPVRDKVLEIIAAKTGYPPDMLQMDLDLEADLGIDTVKQAEMFAAIRAAWDIPREDDLKLRDFPTLAHTVEFVYERRPDLRKPVPAPALVSPAPAPAVAKPASPVAPDPVREKVLAIIAEKTGYPPDMLDLDLDLEADLGIDTVKQAEMFAAIRAAWDIPRDDNLKLRDFPTLAHTIQFVYDRRPDLRRPVSQTPSAVESASTVAEPARVVAAIAADPVREKVLAIIAEKTGYPPDMLDLDLDLEADLGIDTVKQAEMFAAIRAAWDIPRDDNLKLRDFPTLAHTIQFVYDRRPDLSVRGTSAAHAPAAFVEPAQDRADLAATDAVPRRVPVPRLRPKLEQCRPTGVTLGAGTRVVVMPDRGGVGRALANRLEKLGVEVLEIESAPDAETLVRRLQEWKAKAPVQGVFWLSALDPEPAIAGMDLPAWREANRVRVKLLYTAMRALADSIGPRGTFLIAATRLGGQHGYDDAGAFAPLGGAVTGFTKAFRRENGAALVKAVDFEPSRRTTTLADLLIEEARLDPGVVEVGYRGGRRFTVGLEERPAADGLPGMGLGRDTVFVITGAAGSIVSAITADLAAASGGTFHLLDLTPRPDPSSSDLQRFATDKEGLKRDIFERMKTRGERATPAMVERELASIERLHAAQSAIDAVTRAGGTAHYYSADLRSSEAVASAMRQVAERSGRVDVLLHAAGLEISHRLADKAPAEFDLVFDVKADGWFNLMANLAEMPLAAVVAFSSVAGRFGNTGQTDYSAANDLLCKLVSSLRTSRPATRGIAIDWTAWGGIGMATRGSIPTVMREAGIDMLPPDAAIPVVRRELAAGSTRGEIVVAGRLGMMTEELDPTGGLEVGAARWSAAGERGLMIGRVTGMGIHGGLTIETDLDPSRQPFLFDHRISGTPVLPGVMGIEALAEASKLLFPELTLRAVEDVRFLVPFKFHRDQPRTLTLRAEFAPDGAGVLARCSLIGSRTLHGKTEPEVTTHFTAQVRLTLAAPMPENRARVVPPGNGRKLGAADIYRVFFHGPAYQVLASAWKSGAEVFGQLAADLPPNHEPAGIPLLVAPRLIELCFQTAGLVELAQDARMGLPFRIGRIRLLGSQDEASETLFAAVTRNEDGSFDGRVCDEGGSVVLSAEGYRTMQLPDAVSPEILAPLKDALG